MLHIVDIQYYSNNGAIVLKEACIMPVGQPLKIKHFAFRPPFPLHVLNGKDLKTVNYLCNVLGVLHWNEGCHDISDFVVSLPPRSTLLCNGREKSLFLQSVLPLCTILNVNLPFPATTDLVMPSTVQCPISRNHRLCAIKRVCHLYHIMLHDQQ